jgi:hypothetical protein
MKRNLLLEHLMPHRFNAGSKTTRFIHCVPRSLAAKTAPKMLLVAASSLVNGLAAIRKTRVPLTDTAAVALKSP